VRYPVHVAHLRRRTLSGKDEDVRTTAEVTYGPGRTHRADASQPTPLPGVRRRARVQIPRCPARHPGVLAAITRSRSGAQDQQTRVHPLGGQGIPDRGRAAGSPQPGPAPGRLRRRDLPHRSHRSSAAALRAGPAVRTAPGPRRRGSRVLLRRVPGRHQQQRDGPGHRPGRDRGRPGALPGRVPRPHLRRRPSKTPAHPADRRHPQPDLLLRAHLAAPAGLGLGVGRRGRAAPDRTTPENHSPGNGGHPTRRCGRRPPGPRTWPA
jgi:hypothetical protein